MRGEIRKKLKEDRMDVYDVDTVNEIMDTLEEEIGNIIRSIDIGDYTNMDDISYDLADLKDKLY